MKKKICSLFVVLALMSAHIPPQIILSNVYAEETIMEFEYISESEPTEHFETFDASLLNPEDLEEPEDEIIINTRENKINTKSSLINSNKTLWEEMMSSMFGEDHFSPYRQRATEEISGNTNSLKIVETDLRLQGKNGLDLSIRRKYDNQDYDKYHVSKKEEQSLAQYTDRKAYRFNTSTGASIDIAFHTTDEFYKYMYDGCYVTDLSIKSKYTSDSSTKIGATYQQILDKKSTSGIKLTYDSSVPMRTVTVDVTSLYTVTNVDLNVPQYNIGHGWSFDFVSSNAVTDYYLRTKQSSYTKIERDYSGVFTDINGNIHTYTESDKLTTFTSGANPTFSSIIVADNGDPLRYERFYVDQVLDDGTVYNFVITDNQNGLTYYMYHTSSFISSRQISKVVQIVDDYGNKICFDYPSGVLNGFPVHITDTYGRLVVVTPQGIVYNETPGSEEKNIIYELSTESADVLDNDSDLKQKPVARLTVTNPEGEQTVYDSRPVEALAIYTSSNSLTVERPQYLSDNPAAVAAGYNLERITYPTGLEKHYEYVDIYLTYTQGRIMRQMYALEGVYLKDGQNIINKNNYTLSGNTERTITAVREDDGRIVTKAFDTKGRLTNNTTKNSGSTAIISGVSHIYDTNDNITNTTTTIDGVSNVEKYTYLRRGVPYKIQTGKDYTVYNFYESTQIPETVFYYKSGNSTCEYKLVNTFDDDHLKITSTVMETASGLQISKTGYEYDNEGNLTLEKQWFADSDNNGVLDDADAFGVYTKTTITGSDLLTTVADKAVGVVDADGVNTGDTSVEYKFNVYGSPTRQMDSYGNITQIAYDSLNRPVKYIYPNAAKSTIEYSVYDREVTVTDVDGVKYKYTYDAQGNESGKYVYHNEQWKPLYTKEYDNVSGRLSKLVKYTSENNGTVTLYEYDVMDRPVNIVVQEFETNNEPDLLYTTSYSYGYQSPYRTETQTTVRDGITTTVTNKYNNYGELVSTTESDGAETHTVSYTYDHAGRVITTTNSKGKVTTNAYDVKGNIVSVKDALGNVVTYGYDLAGNQTSFKDAKGNTVLTHYDSLDRQIKTESPFDNANTGLSKTYYDKNSRVVKQAVKTNKVGDVEAYSVAEYMYDNMGNVIGALSENGEQDSAVLYEYTQDGKISKMITGMTYFGGDKSKGAKTTYAYNSYGQLETVTDPMGQKTTYTYDYLGNQLTSTDRNGTVFTNTYGVYGVESTVDVNGNKNQSVVNTYDSIGNVTQIKAFTNENLDSTITYSFDGFNRLVSENDGTYTKNYTYDELSNLTNYQLVQNGEIKDSLTYSYDALNRLTAIDNGDTITSYTYDSNSNIINKTSGDFVTDYSYNAANVVTDVTNKYENNVISSYSYEYRPDGNRISETSSDGVTKGYTYDGLGQLIKETVQSPSQNMEYSYEYDRFGNRSLLTQNGQSTTYKYDLNNRLIASTTGDSGTYYNYDANGNQILARVFNLAPISEAKVEGLTDFSDYTINEYDLFNRQVYVNNGGTNVTTYSYHADGLRKSKTTNGVQTSYAWNNGNMVAETNASGTTIYEYDLQGVARRISNGNDHYYIKNAHGDVTGLYNQNGEAITEYIYDAFGNQLNTNENDTNPFRYCGEYFDEETNNIYLRNRYYAPNTGRFITEDPIKDGLNWYVYCGNNPVDRIDPFGMEWGELREFVASYGGTVSKTKTYNGQEYVTISIPELGVEYDYYFAWHPEKINSDGVSMMERITFLDMIGVPYKDTTNIVEVDAEYIEADAQMKEDMIFSVTFLGGLGIGTKAAFGISSLVEIGIHVVETRLINIPTLEMGTYTEQYITVYKNYEFAGQDWLIPAYTTYERKKDGNRIYISTDKEKA